MDPSGKTPGEGVGEGVGVLPVQRPRGARAGQMPGATLRGADDRPLLFACNRAQLAPRP